MGYPKISLEEYDNNKVWINLLKRSELTKLNTDKCATILRVYKIDNFWLNKNPSSIIKIDQINNSDNLSFYYDVLREGNIDKTFNNIDDLIYFIEKYIIIQND